MWEYSNWDISYVEWGNTTTLGNIDSTTSEITSSESTVFKSNLTGLQANTKYYYQKLIKAQLQIDLSVTPIC